MFGTIIGAALSGLASKAITGSGNTASPQQSVTPMIPFAPEENKQKSGIGGLIKDFGSQFIDNEFNQYMAKRNAKRDGRNIRAFNNAAYPGTNPWEQLGGNSAGGSIQSAEKQTKAAQTMQKKELDARKYIAELQASTAIRTSEIQAEPQGRFATLAETKLPEEIQKLSSETRRNIAESMLKMEQGRLTGKQYIVESARAGIAKHLADAELSQKEAGSALQLINTTVKNPDRVIDTVNQLTKPVTDKLKSADKYIRDKIGFE